MRRRKDVEEVMEDEEEKGELDEMMKEVEEEIEEDDGEDGVVSGGGEVRELSEKIEKGRKSWMNGSVEVECGMGK